MKKIMLACMVAATTFAATFTTTNAKGQGTQNQGNQTTLYVDLAIRVQEITAGPYARYAQKYLGVQAPLADKVLHEVRTAKISEIREMQAASENRPEEREVSHMNPAEGFPRLTVDRMTAIVPSQEESARMAAEKIFEIRRSRFDLITGEVGENVFGGGLGRALDELNRLEEEYLSLFLGMQNVRTEVKRYAVTPAKGRTSYTVCRFSETDGAVSQDNLSGVPVVLEVRTSDEGAVQVAVPQAQAKPSARAVAQLAPAQAVCRVILDGEELAAGQFNIRQMGEIVYVTP